MNEQDREEFYNWWKEAIFDSKSPTSVCYATWRAACEYKDRELDAMLAQAIESEDKNPWKAALIDAGVVDWSLNAQNKDDPRKLLNDIILFNMQVALDPQVSSDAAKLVAQARHDVLIEAVNGISKEVWYVPCSILRRMAEEQLKP